jgi:hypothetical protein
MPQTHKEARKVYNATYYQTHKEYHKASAATYYQTHKEACKAYAAKYRKTHPRDRKVANAQYYQTHKEARKVYNKTHKVDTSRSEFKRSIERYARKSGVVPNFSNFEKRFKTWLEAQKQKKRYQAVLQHVTFLQATL